MPKISVQPNRSQKGFTLVELAIVMVIIGLLIGGILKGQELINSAKVSATVSQLKSTDAAFNTFFDKYNVLPGDMDNPTLRLPNCSTFPCNVAGDGGTLGDGRIGPAVWHPGLFPPAGSEQGVTFVQLSAADLITGISPERGPIIGGYYPALKVGGGMWVSYASSIILFTTLPESRHYATLSGVSGTVSITNGALNATTAAQIDRKLDDGLPQSGTAQTFGIGCHDGTTYTEGGAANSTCTMYVRVLN